MPLAAIVVDVHSHVFNAEDLPVDGFLRRLSPTPSLLTAVVSVPLDAVAQRAAPGRSERQVILGLLGPDDGFESIEVGDPVAAPVLTDEDLAHRLALEWRRQGLPVGIDDGFESLDPAPPSDDELAAALAAAPPAEVHELEAWLEEWDPELRAADQFEGLGDIRDLLRGYVQAAKRAVGRYAATFRLFSRHRYEIAGELARTYPEVSLFVPALVDFCHTTSDEPRTRIGDQIAIHSLVAKLSIVGKLDGAAPDTRVAPLVGFDPYREVAETTLQDWDPDRGTPNAYVPFAARASRAATDVYHRGICFDRDRARGLVDLPETWETSSLDLTPVRGGIDLVRNAVELGGFVGVKLYPPAGFFPLGNAFRFPGAKGERLDAALRALYAYCEAMQVPILAHAAHSNGFEPGWNSFAGPAGWELALREFPDLRLCLGHFGHLHGVGADPTSPSVDGWPRRFLELVDRYQHVYADVGNSKVPLSPTYRQEFLAVLGSLLGGDAPDEAQAKRRRRLMYGSDFWMNTMSPSHADYLTGFRTAFAAAAFGPATEDAFMGRNALRFLGFTGDDDEPDFPNRNRRRFVDFHAGRPTPPWLPREGGAR